MHTQIHTIYASICRACNSLNETEMKNSKGKNEETTSIKINIKKKELYFNQKLFSVKMGESDIKRKKKENKVIRSSVAGLSIYFNKLQASIPFIYMYVYLFLVDYLYPCSSVIRIFMYVFHEKSLQFVFIQNSNFFFPYFSHTIFICASAC